MGAVEIISKRLLELRKKHHLLQDDVAKILGVARSSYGNYEQGTRDMDLDLLIKLADYYKVSLDYLLGRTEFPFHIESYTNDEIEYMEKSLGMYKQIKEKYNF